MKNIILLILFGIITLGLAYASDLEAATMNDYCQSPPFVSTVAPPNIFLVVDASGSMDWEAYHCTSSSCPTPPAYDSSQVYEGYFTPDKYYMKCMEMSSPPSNCSFDNNYYLEIANPGLYCGCTCKSSSVLCVAKEKKGQTYVCPTGYRENSTYCSSSSKPCFKCKNESDYSCTGNCDDSRLGKYLNFYRMTRMDLLRWAITGGAPSTCTSANNDPQYCNYEEWTSTTGSGKVQTVCNDDLWINDNGSLKGGCILQSTFDTATKVAVPWSRMHEGLTHIFRDFDIRPRFGGLFYSGSSYPYVRTGSNYQIAMGDFISSDSSSVEHPYRNLISAINSVVPNGGTPSGYAMWDAFSYFKNDKNNLPIYGWSNTKIQSGEGDKWKNPLYQCEDHKNESGEVIKGKCELLDCSKNFIMLLSDGQWNIPSCYIGGSPYNASPDPAVPAHRMHMTFRNVGANIDTTITAVYTLGLFMQTGSVGGDLAMRNVAMYGSHTKSGSGESWPSGTSNYPLTSCSGLVDCGSSGGYGSGSSCTQIPSGTHLDWDKNGDGVPDTYFAASNATGIRDAILSAVLDAMKRTSSGTAVSILSSGEGSGANIIQPVYYPKKEFVGNKEISWISEVQNLWYYLDPITNKSSIREDSVKDNTLNLRNDYITEFFSLSGDTRVNLYADANGDGVRDSSTPVGEKAFDELSSIWKAGRLLWERPSDERTIFTSLDGSSAVAFTSANASLLAPYLQAADSTEAAKIIEFVRGSDTVPSGYRDRKVAADPDSPSNVHVWKLSDIISSTPRTISSTPAAHYHSGSPLGYSDKTYSLWVNSKTYRNRGKAFVGSNGGMLHAFHLGNLLQSWSGQSSTEIAKISNSSSLGIGQESWAYIPKHSLPYLKYLTDPDYCHLFMVNLTPTVVDASVNVPSPYGNSSTSQTCYPSTAPSCSSGDYSDCPKQTCVASNGTVSLSQTSWRTIVIGGMGIGGSCRMPNSSDTGAVKAPIVDPANTSAPLGLSSYFALDVTDQDNPRPLWEFAREDLGFSTSGPAIVRVKNKDLNGKWYAVFASGPTGPIESYQFKGTSNQNLKIFVVDLWTGQLAGTIDTGIQNAFAGPMFSGQIDGDRGTGLDNHIYQHDAVYFGYTQKDPSTGAWTKGGVIRLTTAESPIVSNWKVSKVIDNIGPVTSYVAKLIDRSSHKLWLFFGTGRYFYKRDNMNSQQAFYGVIEPCYKLDSSTNKYRIDANCSSYAGSLEDRTTVYSGDLAASSGGWYVNLSAAGETTGAERVISDPIADSSGTVLFTSYVPDSAVCTSSGTSYLWAMYYKNAGLIPATSQNNTVVVQLSTGALVQVNLADFASKRRSDPLGGSPGGGGAAGGLGLVQKPPRLDSTKTKPFIHLKER